jgi:hypothetical protein
MIEQHGVYEVIGRREYRGHAPGETFVARLDVNAALRAIARGDIRLVERVDPSIDPRRLTLPQGWPGS